MHSPLRNLTLSAVLIAVPAGGFTLAEMFISPTTQAASAAPAALGLGDLSAYRTIVTDTQVIAATGDFPAAERRITDLETLWDQNAAVLRQADRASWNVVDAAADAAFSALRARSPDKATVDAALAGLVAALNAPVAAPAAGPVQYVAGTAVTDETGHALPCEEMIGQLRDALGATAPTPAVSDLRSKALERCNADDDAHADAYAAQALAQLKG